MGETAGGAATQAPALGWTGEAEGAGVGGRLRAEGPPSIGPRRSGDGVRGDCARPGGGRRLNPPSPPLQTVYKKTLLCTRNPRFHTDPSVTRPPVPRPPARLASSLARKASRQPWRPASPQPLLAGAAEGREGAGRGRGSCGRGLCSGEPGVGRGPRPGAAAGGAGEGGRGPRAAEGRRQGGGAEPWGVASGSRFPRCGFRAAVPGLRFCGACPAALDFDPAIRVHVGAAG